MFKDYTKLDENIKKEIESQQKRLEDIVRSCPLFMRTAFHLCDERCDIVKLCWRLQDEEEKIEVFSPADQERYREIKEISYALNDLRDHDAARLLEKFAKKIEPASDIIKAKYYNNKGVLLLHKHAFKEAVSFLGRSCQKITPAIISKTIIKIGIESFFNLFEKKLLLESFLPLSVSSNQRSNSSA